MARATFNEPYDEGKTLIFPQDMDRQFFPEAIKFSIYKRDGASYSAFKGKVKSTFEDMKKITNPVPDEEAEQSNEAKVAGAAAKLGERVKELFLDDKKGSLLHDAMSMRQGTGTYGAGPNGKYKPSEERVAKFGELAKIKPDEHTSEQHKQSIYLNMPESVAFSEGVQWQGSDLGVIGAALNGGLSGAIENGLLSGVGATLGGGAGALANMIPGVSGIAAPIIGAALGSGGLQSGIESTFGVKANPYKEQTFQGVDFRSFDFTFTLRALNDSDVTMIRDIISAFRAHSKPNFEGDKGQSGVFEYPMEFRIEFLTIDNTNSYVTNKYLPEIKYCVCTGVNTNFAQQGWNSFEGGAPVDVSLQLTFQETEIITSDDVRGKTTVGKFKESGRKF
mgnify:CR=1 FL=1|jgi:hypothetical protein